jgi:hypothetical protein
MYKIIHKITFIGVSLPEEVSLKGFCALFDDAVSY